MKHIFKALLVGAIALLSINAYGQSNSKSDWKEVQTVVLPSDVTIYEGVTRNGSPKCWIVVEDINVPVAVGNAQKFKMHQVQLELVKWHNPTTGKYRYSTRQVKSASSNKGRNIDLVGLFR